MFLEETPEQLALRQELRAYYADLLTDEVRPGIGEVGEGGELWRQVVGRIGKDGWLGIGWPKEYGGQGRPATDQFIFFDETRRAERPVPVRDREHRGPDDHALRHRRAEVVLPARHPGRGASTSPSATPSPRRGPTWPRCGPGPCATATSTW